MTAFFRDDWLRKIFFAIAAAPVIGIAMTGDYGAALGAVLVAALITGGGWYIRWIMDRSGWPPDRDAPVRRNAPLWHYVWLLPLIYLLLLFLQLTG